MQVIGLSVPPLAVIVELAGGVTLKQMLLLLVFALCLFWIGRLLEGYAPGA